MNNEEFYVIQNSKGLYHTRGSSWNKSIRMAAKYKTRKSALANCWNFNSNNYKNVKLLKIKVEIVSEEEVNPNEFAGFDESRCH
jgi:hypothetical protein